MSSTPSSTSLYRHYTEPENSYSAAEMTPYTSARKARRVCSAGKQTPRVLSSPPATPRSGHAHVRGQESGSAAEGAAAAGGGGELGRDRHPAATRRRRRLRVSGERRGEAPRGRTGPGRAPPCAPPMAGRAAPRAAAGVPAAPGASGSSGRAEPSRAALRWVELRVRMKKEQVVHCQFSVWYPLFRAVTIRR